MNKLLPLFLVFFVLTSGCVKTDLKTKIAVDKALFGRGLYLSNCDTNGTVVYECDNIFSIERTRHMNIELISQSYLFLGIIVVVLGLIGLLHYKEASQDV